MENRLSFDFEDVFNIGSVVLSVAAGLLGVLFLVLKHRALGRAEQPEESEAESKAGSVKTATDTGTGNACDTTAQSKDKDETVPERSTDDTETTPNIKDTEKAEEIAKLLKGAGKCPFSQMGGSWPPDQGDFMDTADKSPNKDIPVEDPKQFCDHIPSQVKRTQQRVAIQKIEETMDEKERENEREIQRQQLEAIFKLMAEEKDKFGLESMDDVQSQMHLYVQ